MSFANARLLLGELATEVTLLQQKFKDLEADVLQKSETLARLERKKDLEDNLPPSRPPAALALFGSALNGGLPKLKPTKTKVSNEHAFPEIEKESAEASEIKPWLLLAGNIVARDLKLLRELHVTRIVNAARTVCPNYHEKEPDLHYTSFELIDHPKETIDHFILQAIAEIEGAREANERILVHCHQGISRSATLVVAYVAWKDNLPIMDALMYVKARRKIISPNAGFLEQLNQFERRIRLEPSATVQPSLHHVTTHSDDVSTLVVKQVFDPTLPLVDEDDVFLIHEGHGGNIFIREPLIKTDPRLMETAIQVAGWMSKYEVAYKNASVLVVPNEDTRFAEALKTIPEPTLAQLKKGEVEEHVIN